MIRFIPALLVSLFAILATSCGCKKELNVPPLRPMPQFPPPSFNPEPSMDALLDRLEDKLTEEEELPTVVPTK